MQASLKRIGALLDSQLDDSQRSAFRSARSITFFSEFPWGLATLAGDSSPMCTAVPTIYRALTPLTRTLQLELQTPPPRYLGKGFKVLIAECLHEQDRIRRLSEVAWRVQANQIPAQTGGKAECRYEIVESPAYLRCLLEAEQFDVLVVSAHGMVDPYGRLAGIQMASGPVIELEMRVPPLVIFSACSVAPRGSGAVSIADFAFRWGALAVLGTLFPVDVRHNAILMTRLFVYMCECIEQRGTRYDLAEVVNHTLATNAVIDVLHGSKKLQQWAYTSSTNGKDTPLVQFMRENSVERLFPGHIYRETEAVVLEVAKAHGESTARHLQHYLDSQSYVPESLFYMLLGSPERILLQARPEFRSAFS